MKHLKHKWNKITRIKEVTWIECLTIKRTAWLKITKVDSKNLRKEKHQNLMICKQNFKNKLMILNGNSKKKEQIYTVMPRPRDKKCKLKLTSSKNSWVKELSNWKRLRILYWKGIKKLRDLEMRLRSILIQLISLSSRLRIWKDNLKKRGLMEPLEKNSLERRLRNYSLKSRL